MPETILLPGFIPAPNIVDIFADSAPVQVVEKVVIGRCGRTQLVAGKFKLVEQAIFSRLLDARQGNLGGGEEIIGPAAVPGRDIGLFNLSQGCHQAGLLLRGVKEAGTVAGQQLDQLVQQGGQTAVSYQLPFQDMTPRGRGNGT